LIARRLEGTLPEGDARTLEDHLSVCGRCRAELMLQTKIRDALGEETHSGLSAGFAERVSHSVAEMAEAERDAKKWVSLVPALALGTAAMALFLVGADLIRVLPSPSETLSSAVFKPIGWFLESVASALAGAFGFSGESNGAPAWLSGAFARTLFIALVGSLPGVWGLHKIFVFMKE
jgi:anti-sigma factor RsiW